VRSRPSVATIDKNPNESKRFITVTGTGYSGTVQSRAIRVSIDPIPGPEGLSNVGVVRPRVHFYRMDLEKIFRSDVELGWPRVHVLVASSLTSWEGAESLLPGVKIFFSL